MLTSDEKTSNTEPCRGDLRRVAGMVLSTATLTRYRSLATGCTRVTEYALSRALQLVPERPETARLNLDDMAAVDRVYNEALDGLFSRAADDGVALL